MNIKANGLREPIWLYQGKIAALTSTQYSEISSAPDVLLEVLQALKKEQEESVRTIIFSWNDYRRYQEMWNPNYATAGELDPL